MKNSTLQSQISFNAVVIKAAEETIQHYLDSAKFLNAVGEKAFAIADYKEAGKFRAILAKRVAAQIDMKAEMAFNNQKARIEAKKTRLFGAVPAVNSPEHIAYEVESVLDDLIANQFPAKADTRPADHPSFKKAA